MTLRKRIILGFVLVFVIGVFLGIGGIISAKIFTERNEKQYTMQLASSEISTVLTAHYTWRQAITEAVLDQTEFTGSVDSATCALGKWEHSDAALAIEDDKLKTSLASVKEPHAFIHSRAADVVELQRNGKHVEATRIVETEILPTADTVIDALTVMDNRYLELLKEENLAVTKLGDSISLLLTCLIGVAFLVSLFFAYKIISSIMKPLRAIARDASKVAIGDLNIDVSYSVNDELGQVVNAFHTLVDSIREQVAVTEGLAGKDLTVTTASRSELDTMNKSLASLIDGLNEVFLHIQESTSQVYSGASQISSAATLLAQGATEQAATVEELSASINDVKEKTIGNSQLAEEASALAEEMKKDATNGVEQMERMTVAVDNINQASQSISKVMKSIDDIAFQTNILALNAAVEAARAGQHGKGFAVVADEVRNLAAKSAAAAKETGELINEAISRAEEGSKIAGITSESFSKIMKAIEKCSLLVSQISQASAMQASAISEINVAVEQVSMVTQQNSATAEESAAASEQMHGQANVLKGFVDDIKLRR